MITSRPLDGSRSRYFWRALMRARMLASRGFQVAQQPEALVAHAMLERVDDAGIELATRRCKDASVGGRRRQGAAYNRVDLVEATDDVAQRLPPPARPSRRYGGYAPLPHGPR